jgi:hypothetical protein
MNWSHTATALAADSLFPGRGNSHEFSNRQAITVMVA